MGLLTTIRPDKDQTFAVLFKEKKPQVMENRAYSLVYTSTATEEMSAEQIRQLLHSARPNNQRIGITGMLLYCEGLFIQAIEGEQQQVEALYRRICEDPRHHMVTTLLKRPIERRRFNEWEMGYYGPFADDLADEAGFTDFLTVGLLRDELIKQPSLAMKLLMSFRRHSVRA